MESTSSGFGNSSNNGFPPAFQHAVRRLAVYTVVLVAVFTLPLYQLARLGLKEDLYSHALLMPVIAGFLVMLTRHRLPKETGRSPLGTAFFAGMGVICLLAWAFFAARGHVLQTNDRLAFSMGALVSFFVAGVLYFLGPQVARGAIYPFGLLLFMVPFPTPVRHFLEVVLQHSSAEVAYWMIKLAQIPILRDGVVFVLPGITLQVAEECSGIRSSLVLFIMGLSGGFLILGNPRHRLLFALIMIPLGIVRNGFRVMTLAVLCVHIDSSMIHSPIHHRGGPLFFLLSLIPCFALLLYWRKKELQAAARITETTTVRGRG